MCPFTPGAKPARTRRAGRMTDACRSFPGHSTSPAGGGVIWGGIPFRNACHSRPAMAGGIQSFDGALPKVCRVDSRFRWNDCGLQRPGLANDASTRLSCPMFLAGTAPLQLSYPVPSGMPKKRRAAALRCSKEDALAAEQGACRRPRIERRRNGSNGSRLPCPGRKGTSAIFARRTGWRHPLRL
jgi:hypothetical protein